MGVLDFLFEGKPPKAVTTYGQTVENIPKWMSDYTQGLISRANAIAAEPYQAYQGPRIAGFSPDEQAAFQATRGAVGAYRPYLGAATGLAGRAGMADPLQAAGGALQAASRTATGRNVDPYLNPYISNVLGRQESLAKRSFEEQFLPGLQDIFTKGGQYGSERMQELAQRGTRDIMENLEEQRLATLGGAYESAAGRQATDAERAAQLAGTIGNLTTAGGELDLAAARQMGALGEFASTQGLRDAAALEAIGQTQRGLGQRSLDLAYEDFARQRDYPRQTIDWMSQVIRGLPAPAATQRTEVGPASQYGPSPLSQIAGAYSAYKGLQAKGGYIKPKYRKGGLARVIDVTDYKVEGYDRKKKSPQFHLEYSNA